MPTGTIAYLQRKKEPFLKALIRFGKVAPATRAVRISRDAVYDWLRADADFRRAFQQAKRDRYDRTTATLADALDFFLDTVKPIIPAEFVPRVVSAIQLTLSQRRFNANAGAPRVASRNKVRFPSFDVYPEPASSGNDGNRVFCQGKNGPHS